MPLAFIITLEKEIPEQTAYSKTASGKALAREIDRLDHAARVRKVPAITSMLSESPEKLMAQMREEGFDPSKMRLPPEQWYPAADGLRIVRALHEQVSEKLNDFKQPNPILRELKAADDLLAAADRAAVRFHFTKTAL